METVEIVVVAGALAGVAVVFWYFFPRARVSVPAGAGTGDPLDGKAPMSEPTDPRTVRLSVRGMTCGNCVRHVMRALEGVPGVAGAEVDLEGGKATARIESGSVDPAALVSAVTEAGYEAEILEG